MSSPYRPYFQQYQQAQQDPLSAALRTPGTERGPLAFNMESVGELGKQMGAEAEANKKPRVWETKVDSEGNMTLKTDQETVNWVTSSAKKYQELMAGYAQTLQQQQAYTQHRLNNQNPLINVLGTFASNIARQPNMPGVTQALGQTAAQLNPTVDQLQDKQLGLYEHGAKMAASETDRAFKQEQVRTAQEQRIVAEQDKVFMGLAREAKQGTLPADKIAELGKSKRITEEQAAVLGDMSKAAATVRDQKIGIAQQAAEARDELGKARLDHDKWKTQFNADAHMKRVLTQQAGATGRTRLAAQLKSEDITKILKVQKDAVDQGTKLGAAIRKATDRAETIHKDVAKLKADSTIPDDVKQPALNQMNADLEATQTEINRLSADHKEQEALANRITQIASDALDARQAGQKPAAPAAVSPPAAQPITKTFTDPKTGKDAEFILKDGKWVPKK